MKGVESGVESGLEEGLKESNMAKKILFILQKESLSKSEIAKKLGKDKPGRYLNELIAQMTKNGILELTIPDKPNSRLQKYKISK